MAIMDEKALFKIALGFVLKWEGGYSNRPHDKGGPTNKGITQGTYDEYRVSKRLPKKAVIGITEAEVEDIYYHNYWLATDCDKMSRIFAIYCFDTAVNMGESRVKEFLKDAEFSKSDAFLLARIRKYNEFVAADKTQLEDLEGWLNRVLALRDFVLALK